MLTIWTVGMAIGAMAISKRVPRTAIATAGLVGAGIQGAALALPAALLSVPFFFACMFVGGTAHGVKNVMFRSLIHLRVPGEAHGQAFSTYNGVRNAAELGAFAVGGALVAAVGARGTLVYAGGISAAIAVAGLAVYRRMRLASPLSETEAEGAGGEALARAPGAD